MTKGNRQLIVRGTIVAIGVFLLFHLFRGLWNNIPAVSVSGSVQLTRNEYNALLKNVLLGDSQAADSLADFYLWGERRDDGIGLLLREKATFLGNERSKVLLKDFLGRYGMQNYRDFIGRTNTVVEEELLKILGPIEPLRTSNDTGSIK